MDGSQKPRAHSGRLFHRPSEIVVARLVQREIFRDRTRRDNRTMSRRTSPLARAGSSICSQMATLALGDQAGDIALRGVVGNAAHRDPDLPPACRGPG